MMTMSLQDRYLSIMEVNNRLEDMVRGKYLLDSDVDFLRKLRGLRYLNADYNWKTREGTYINIVDLSDSHLQNILDSYLEDKERIFNRIIVLLLVFERSIRARLNTKATSQQC